MVLGMLIVEHIYQLLEISKVDAFSAIFDQYGKKNLSWEE